jgi:hypothetical protein
MEDPTSNPDELLAEVIRVRRLTRGALADGSWRYLAVWSVVFLGSWITSFYPIGQFYWILGLPVGYIGMWLMFRGQQPAAWNRDAPYWITGLSIAVVNTAAGLILPDEAVVVVVWVVIGIGFGVLSWLDRQPVASGLFFGLGVASGVLGLVVEDRFLLYNALALVFTLAAGGAGLILWLGARQHAPGQHKEAQHQETQHQHLP